MDSVHTHVVTNLPLSWSVRQMLFACLTVCLPTACAGLVLAGDITSCLNMQRTLASDGSWLLEPVQICQADSEARYRRGLQMKHGSAGILPRQTLTVIRIALAMLTG
jgi:hypothetical protein